MVCTLVADTKYASRLCDCSPEHRALSLTDRSFTTFQSILSNKEHLLQPVRQTNIMHQSPRHTPALAQSSNLISDEMKKAIATT